MLKPNVQGIQRFFDENNKFLKNISSEYKKKLQTKIQQEFSDTGELLNSIFVRQQGNGNFQIGSNKPQAWVAEYGRKPGSSMPNFDSLSGWMARKGFVSGSNYDNLASKDKSKVYLVARKIARDGIEAKELFSQVLGI